MNKVFQDVHIKRDFDHQSQDIHHDNLSNMLLWEKEGIDGMLERNLIDSDLEHIPEDKPIIS